MGLALQTCAQALLKLNQHSFDSGFGLGLRLERTPALQPERKSGPGHGRELALDLDMILNIDLDVDLNSGVDRHLDTTLD